MEVERYAKAKKGAKGAVAVAEVENKAWENLNVELETPKGFYNRRSLL